jgi:DNA repair protein RadC
VNPAEIADAPTDTVRDLLRRGASVLPSDRLLGLLLEGGEPAARALLALHGSLRGLVGRSAEELSRAPGVGPADASRLRAAFEIAARVAEERLPRGMRVSSSRAVYEAYRARLGDHRKEVFLALLLDGRNRLIREERVSEGTLTSSVVHPREVYTAAIREGAAAVILVHNHPSGDPSPSPEDVEITARLVEVGRLVGIKLLDHVILGDGCFASCFERGIVDAT